MTVIQGGIVPRMDIALAVAEEMPDLDQFVSHRVFPIFETAISTGPLPKFLRRNRVERLYKPKYGEFPTSALTVDIAATFDCKEAGFDELLDQKDKEILGGSRGEDSARYWAALKSAQMVLLARDNALALNLMTTTTFGAGYNAAAVGTWGGGTDKPINDVSNAVESSRKRCGKRPNRLLISGTGWVKLLQSAQIQTNFKQLLAYTSADGTNFYQQTRAMAMALGLGEDGDVIIGGSVKNTADDGQTAALSSVWDDTKALVFYAAQPTDLISPGLGRTFIWGQGYNGYYAQPGIGQNYDPLRGLVIENVFDVVKNIERMRAREYVDMLLCNKEAGYLITGI